MSRAPEVIPQSPPPLAAEPTSREQGGVLPLDDDLVMDVYNLSFDEFQRRIPQGKFWGLELRFWLKVVTLM